MLLGLRCAQLHGLAAPDQLGNRVVDQRIQAVIAQGLGHFRLLSGARADVATDELLGRHVHGRSHRQGRVGPLGDDGRLRLRARPWLISRRFPPRAA